MSGVNDWIMVMHADGQHSFRTIVKKILKDEGITHFVEADNGRHALELILHLKKKEGVSPDVIICELEMEKMGGQDVIKFLRDHKDQTPVIILTGEQDETVLEGIREESGAAAVLQKPVSGPNLVSEIQKAIGAM